MLRYCPLWPKSSRVWFWYHFKRPLIIGDVYVYIFHSLNVKICLHSNNNDNNLKAIMFQLIKQNYNKKMQLHIFLWRE